MKKLEINEYSLAASAMVCNEEFKAFKDAFKWLISSQYNLNAVENGRWSTKDMEAVITKETSSLSEQSLRRLRIAQLQGEFEKAAKVAVRKFNLLNKKYGEVTGTYIVPFAIERDKAIRARLIELAQVA